MKVKCPHCDKKNKIEQMEDHLFGLKFNEHFELKVFCGNCEVSFFIYGQIELISTPIKL
jgi:hypothetical protein